KVRPARVRVSCCAFSGSVSDDSDRTITNRMRLSVKKGEPKQGKAKQSMTPYVRRSGGVSLRRKTRAEMNTSQNETLAIRLPTALVVHLRHWAFMKEVSLATFIEESLTRFCQELAAENKRRAQETEPARLLSVSGSFVTTHE